jgi:hypothetical protein
MAQGADLKPTVSPVVLFTVFLIQSAMTGLLAKV